MILIDSYYFYLESRKYAPTGIDIVKLLEYLQANGYKPKHRKWITSYRDDSMQNFYAWLKTYNGPHFEVILKGIKDKRFVCSYCNAINTTLVEKGNDVELASWIVKGAFTNMYETLILVSGDGDYETPVRMAKEAGKKVVLVGNGDTVSTDLQYLATDFVELGKIKGLEK